MEPYALGRSFESSKPLLKAVEELERTEAGRVILQKWDEGFRQEFARIHSIHYAAWRFLLEMNREARAALDTHAQELRLTLWRVLHQRDETLPPGPEGSSAAPTEMSTDYSIACHPCRVTTHLGQRFTTGLGGIEETI